MSNSTFRISNQYGQIDYYKNDEEMLKQVEQNIFFEQHYVEQWLSPYISKAKVILDIGAHCGSHTIMYKSINPDCTVYAFEPQSMLHRLLESNVSMNSLSNVFCFNKAVGERNAIVEMNPYSTDGSNNYSGIEYGTDNVYNLAGVQVGSGGEEVEMIAIDDLNLEACDLIKIDVEGYEPHVIEGAIKTIRKFRPAISYESNSKVSGKSTISSLERLTRIGYVSMNVWGDNWIAI